MMTGPSAVVGDAAVRVRWSLYDPSARHTLGAPYAEGATMTLNASPLLQGWRYGIHPRAAGMRVSSLSRVELPLGEALRLELESDQPAGSAERHLQYYVMTEMGPWALWISCPSDELPDREQVLQRLEYHLTSDE